MFLKLESLSSGLLLFLEYCLIPYSGLPWLFKNIAPFRAAMYFPTLSYLFLTYPSSFEQFAPFTFSNNLVPFERLALRSQTL